MNKKTSKGMWDIYFAEMQKDKLEMPISQDSLDIELLTPKQIVQELDQIVIGQTEAKQLLAIAAFNRLLALKNRQLERDKEDFFFEKNNILLIGNTGCGKTHLVRALSQIVSLPVVIQDATSFTSNGYVGRSVEECIEALMKAAESFVDNNYNIDPLLVKRRTSLVNTYAEYGIIYIDEADKIRTSSGPGKDVNGRSVQESFLKLVEGIEIKTKRNTLDTSNILFIFGGAFAGLEQIIAKRLDKKTIGFVQDEQKKIDKTNLIQNSCIKDFTDFGMIPELMGRLSTIAPLTELTESMIVKIFSEPKYSIMSQVINEFKSYGVEISFTDQAIEHIAKEALSLKLGARGLKGICQKLLRPLYYHMPSLTNTKKILVTQTLLEYFKEMKGDIQI